MAEESVFNSKDRKYFQNIHRDFESEVNRLGLKAVSCIDNETEFRKAFRKFFDYYRENYLYYRLGKEPNGLKEFFYNSIIPEDIHDACLAVFDVVDDTVIDIIKRYDASKQSAGKYPFFYYINKSLRLYIDRKVKKEKTNEKKAFMLSQKDYSLLKKIEKMYWRLEKPNGTSDEEDIKFICEELDITRNRYESIANLSELLKAKSFDERSENSIDSDDEYLSLHEKVADKSRPFEDSVFVLESIFDEDSILDFDLFEDTSEVLDTTLEKLNIIYRESFFQKTKVVYPKGLTNEYLKFIVKSANKQPESFEQTVATKWDLLRFEERRDRYANGKYLCIDRYMFDWFERVKRQILSKEIADLLGLTPSNYSKIYEKASSLVARELKNK